MTVAHFTCAFIASYLLVMTPQVAPLSPAAALAEMRSDDWRVRSMIVDRIRQDPDSLRDQGVKRGLIELLDRETRLIRDPNREHPDPREKSDDYSEYYAWLDDLVSSIVEPGDTLGVSVLVRATEDGGSPLDERLASYGEPAVPALLELANSGDGSRRAAALRMMGFVLRQQRISANRLRLSDRSLHEVETRLRGGLRDPEPIARQSSMFGVVAAGDLDSLPLLEQLRASDPYTAVLPDGIRRFPLRDQAKEAIAAIKATPLLK